MGRRGESGGGDASSSHRLSSYRSYRSDQRNDKDDMDDCGDRHRHRHRDGNDDRDGDSLDGRRHRHRHRHRSSHHRRRGSTERRGDVDESMQPERVSRSHRRPRRERDEGGSEYDDFGNDRLSRRFREHSEDDTDDRHGRRTKGKRYRDTAAADGDDGHQRGHKYRCDGRLGVDEVSHGASDNHVADASDCRAYGDRFQTGNRVAGPSYTANNTMDWSSRRGRQRMPSFAYNVDQQKRFLGFLDRRDASRDRAGAGAAAMEFTIGADGLVQMPPPPTLVRRQNRHRIGPGSNYRNGSSSWQQEHRKRSPPDCAATTANADGEQSDDKSSVASHESLYHDPATVHVGILPDIIPPSNLYRVALFGVDLSLTASHLSSIVTQLLGGGVKPWRVRRPAREMLHVAASYSRAAQSHQQLLSTPLTSQSTITCTPSVSHAVLGEESAGAASLSGVIAGPPASVSNTLHTVATSAIGVLSGKAVAVGGGGGGVLPDADDDSAASGVLGYGAEKNSGILHYASPFPPSLQPTPPAFYLPGLHDANGPGGMVVLEFTEQTHACRSVQLLNGAYVNGRRVAASM